MKDKARLKLIQEASDKLIKTLDIDKVLKHILKIAKKGLDADRGTVYVVHRAKKEIWSKVLIGKNPREIHLPFGKGIAGIIAKTGETINISNAYKDKRFNQDVDKRTGYQTKNILCMPIKNSKNEIVGVFQMLNKRNGKFNGNDEEFLKSLSNYSAVALELAMLHQEFLDKKRIEHELSIAREIQVSLFPHSIPIIDGYEVFGKNISCETVSGDYYDCYPIGNNKWIIAIGDVAGKGVPASLMMAMLQSHLKAIIKYNNSLPDIMKILNQYLIENSTPEKYITFFLGILDAQNGTFQYLNAGHNPPVYITAGDTIKPLKIGGPIIGMLPGLEFMQETLYLQKDDLIFCYTDGITEYFNKHDEEYGEDKLLKFLKENCQKNLQELLNSLLRDLEAFGSGEKQKDDITILMLRKR